jgi:hypothetical protein
VWGIAHLKQSLRQCWRQRIAAALKNWTARQWNGNCSIFQMEDFLTPQEAQAKALGIEQLFSACEALQTQGKADQAIELQR